MLKIETSGEKATLKKYNPGHLPEAGSEWCGKFFNSIWEDARKEKISRLGLHQRWLDLHAQYRGKKKKKKYPRVGANHLFKIVESYCATLTEKVPISDISADDADNPLLVKALSQENEEFWHDTEQQGSLHASTLNMQIYGTTIEKGTFNTEKDDVEILLRDPFNIFPAPGYRMCDMSIPYICEVDFLEEWEIRGMFGVPKDVTIPSDAEEQLAGTVRETTRGGKADSDTGRHYPTNYAPVQDQSGGSEALKSKTLVVEIWIRDNSYIEEPVMAQQYISDAQGRPIVVEVETGEMKQIPVYRDGIRKVVLCPALMKDPKIKGVLEDIEDPNINWALLETRIQSLVETGQPNPMTGQVTPISEEEAEKMVYDRAKTCYPLWGEFPYSAIPSRIDTTQWWGFSTLEQLEELQGKEEAMLTKYLTALERQMFPIFLNVQGSGVENHEITNAPGLVIRPTVASAPFLKYLESPMPPSEYLEALQFILYEMDIISMTPEVTEGRRPKGVSAASAIIALQDKASTLFTPQVRQVDKLTRNRGKFWIHFKLNFDTTQKQVKVDNEFIQFKGVDLFSAFKFNVEAGSSAPITKAGRRQQYVELRKMGDMDRLSMLEFLDIPQAKLIHERIVEQEGVNGALQILLAAGLPEPVIMQIQQMVAGEQHAPQPHGGTTMRTPEQAAPQAGGYSEGMTAANNQMSELREG